VKAERSGYYYKPHGRDNRALRLRILDIANAGPGFGYLRIHILLRREGWLVDKKCVYRIYTEEMLQVRTKQRRKRISQPRVRLPLPGAVNEHRSMDFIHDPLEDGRKFRILTVVDQFSRECPILAAEHSLSWEKVVEYLEGLRRRRGLPKAITVDNGTEFISKALDAWAYRNGIHLDYIRPGKPVENACIESFNGRLRDECSNANVFAALESASSLLEAWRQDYNNFRPHTSADGMPPAEYAAKCREGLKTAAVFQRSVV